jgi:hypothetical protein
MKNWKTTLIGCIIATLGILKTTVEAYQNGTPIDWMKVTICIAVAVFGLVMKDFDVTGVGPTAMNAKTAAKITSISLIMLLIGGCASNQLVSATASNGDQFPYCLEARFKLNPLQADTLFCAGLSEIQAEQVKQAALHPDATYTIVAQKRVTK